MRVQTLCSMVTAVALMTVASTGMVLAADTSSASASVRPVAKSYRVSTAAVAAAPSRRCNTIACSGYVIVGIAY
jgi:hypothetical protein